jgi:hypothetical protein
MEKFQGCSRILKKGVSQTLVSTDFEKAEMKVDPREEKC